jgi:Cu2+-exporting ATPase
VCGLKILQEKVNIHLLIVIRGCMKENAREMTFQAEAIACSGCAGDMENILRETEGIIDASVDFAGETVWIKYDPQKLDRKKVFFAVRRLGYKIRIISEDRG